MRTSHRAPTCALAGALLLAIASSAPAGTSILKVAKPSKSGTIKLIMRATDPNGDPVEVIVPLPFDAAIHDTAKKKREFLFQPLKEAVESLNGIIPGFENVKVVRIGDDRIKIRNLPRDMRILFDQGDTGEFKDKQHAGRASAASVQFAGLFPPVDAMGGEAMFALGVSTIAGERIVELPASQIQDMSGPGVMNALASALLADPVLLPQGVGPITVNNGSLRVQFDPGFALINDGGVTFGTTSIGNANVIVAGEVDAAPLPPCDGDVNDDLLVNFDDLNQLLSEFGQTGPGLPADLNGDEAVNFGDLNDVLGAFGADCAPDDK